jgi:hypothetical protein
LIGFAFVLALALAAATRPALAQSDFRRGDANSDGVVDLSDGVFVFDFLFLGGSPPTCLAAADADKSLMISYTDAVSLLQRSPGIPVLGPDDSWPTKLPCASYEPRPPSRIADVSLGFDGCPAELRGRGVKAFDAFITLTTTASTSGNGPEAWSLSITADGGTIRSIGFDEIEVSALSSVLGSDPEPASIPVYGHLAYVAVTGSHKDDPSRRGAAAICYLSQPGRKNRLSPEGTQRIVRITVEADIPSSGDPVPLTLRFEDGFLNGIQSNFADNLVTIDGTTQIPALGSCTVLLVPGDCNENGIEDGEDLSSGASDDCNQNGVPDECDVRAGSLKFSSSKEIEVISSCTPATLVPGDLDGDGLLDLVAGNSIFKNLGSGSLGPRTVLTQESTATAIGDLNGDRLPDIAMANSGGNVSILLQTGNGAFPAGVSYPLGSGPKSLVAADLDGDGLIDLAGGVSGGISILKNGGEGTFPSKTMIPLDSETSSHPSILAADLDGDGDDDLVTADNEPPGVSVLRNDGAIEFAKNRYEAGDSLEALAIADLDGDGALDLAVANATSGKGLVLLNDGGGAFSAPLVVSLPGAWKSVATADLDGDGWTDLAYATKSAGLCAAVNRGGASFSEGLQFSASSLGAVQAICAADMDSDGLTDIVACGSSWPPPAWIFTNETIPPMSGVPDDCPPPGGLRRPGDANGDGSLDISDPVMVLGVLFTGSAKAFPCGDGLATDAGNVALVDWQPDGAIDISDAVAMLSLLFLGGRPHALAVPGESAACARIAGCEDATGCR